MGWDVICFGGNERRYTCQSQETWNRNALYYWKRFTTILLLKYKIILKTLAM